MEHAAKAQATGEPLQSALDALARFEKPEEFVPAILCILSGALEAPCAYFEYREDRLMLLRCWRHDGEVRWLDRTTPQEISLPGVVRTLVSGTALAPGLGRCAGPVEMDRSASGGLLQEFAMLNGGEKELHIPLAIGGSPAGAFAIYRNRAREFAPSEIALVERVGHHLARALEVDRMRARAGELEWVSKNISDALASFAAEPSGTKAVEALLLALNRQLDSESCFWFEYDAESRMLHPSIRIQDDRVLDGPFEDEPELFRQPFHADITPAFRYLCQSDDFVVLTNLKQNDLLWPGVAEWHLRYGRLEALAFAVKIGETPLGVVGIAFRRQADLTPARKLLVRAMSNQLAVAVHRNRLEEAARRREVEAARLRERQIVTEQHRAELQRATEALAASLRGLLAQGASQGALEALLLELARQLNAAGHWYEYHKETNLLELKIRFEDGRIVPRLRGEPAWLSTPFSADITPAFRYMCESDDFPLLSLEEHSDLFWPETRAWHIAQGMTEVLSCAVKVGDLPIGMIGITFRNVSQLGELQKIVVRALSNQLALAVCLLRLATRMHAKEIETTRAREQERAAAERSEILDRSNRVLRRVALRLGTAEDFRQVTTEALRAVGDMLEPLGVLGVGLIRYTDATRTARIEIYIHEGVELPYPGDGFLVDTPTFIVPWRRIQAEDFIWGLTSDPSVLVPEIREFHEAKGVRAVGYAPIRKGSATVGWVGFELASVERPSGLQMDFIRTLAAQIALAAEMERLAVAAQEVAIAAEREQAARAYAMDLAKANKALRQSIDILALNRDLDSFLEQVLQSSLGHLEGAVAQIFLFDPKTGMLSPSVASDHQSTYPAPGFVMAFQEEGPFKLQIPAGITPLWEQMISSRKPVLMDPEVDTDLFWPGTIPWHREQGHTAVVCCALVVGDQKLGMLGLGFRSDGNIDETKLEFIQSMAQQVSLAMLLSRLSEETRLAAALEERERIAQKQARQARRISGFLQRTVTGLSSEDSSEFFGSILRSFAEELGAKHVLLFLHNGSARTLELTASAIDGTIRKGPSGDEVPLFARPFSDSITPAWELMCRRRGLFTPRLLPAGITGKEFVWPGVLEYAERFGISDMAHIVLFAGDEPVGGIGFSFDKGRVLTDEDREFVEGVAEQAALAVRMVDLAESAKQAHILKEREAALAGANEALSRSVTWVSSAATLGSIQGALLRDSIRESGAVSGCLYLYDSESSAFFNHSHILRGEEIDVENDPRAVPVRGPFPADKASANRKASNYEFYWQDAEDANIPLWPGMRDFHARMGHRWVASIPMQRGKETIGILRLAFDSGITHRPPDTKLEIPTLLAKQAALALEVRRLAEEARRTELAREQERIVAEERARLARDIHDTLAQGYAAILAQVQDLGYDFPPETHPDVSARLRRIEELARHNLANARNKIHALRAEPTTQVDLSDALEQWVREALAVAGSGLDVEIRFPPKGRVNMATHRAFEVSRIVQEALHNVRRHARTSKALVEASVDDGRLVIRIADRGVGFDVSAPLLTFGIRTMRERAGRAGASLEIQSAPGQGTNVRLLFNNL